MKPLAEQARAAMAVVENEDSAVTSLVLFIDDDGNFGIATRGPLAEQALDVLERVAEALKEERRATN